jgi:Tfp pilus assembly protein PilF
MMRTVFSSELVIALGVALALAAGACGGPQKPATVPQDPLATIPAHELFERGLAFESAGDLIRAEQYMAASIERGHSEAEVIEPLLRVCLKASRFGAALVHAERYLKSHPKDWRMRYLVATLYVAVGHTSAAEGQLRRVIDERPGEAQPHLALAQLYAGIGNERRAARHYRAYLARNADGDDAYAARAWLDDWKQTSHDRRRKLRRNKRRH